MKYAITISIAVLVTVSVMIFWSDASLALDLPQSMYTTEDNTRLIQCISNVSGLYDETELKTMYLEFDQSNWWEQLEANYFSGTEIPADLTCDGKTYPGVGIRFKGNSSYRFIDDSEKTSFNITIDYSDSTQRLDGYKTLNLNNCYTDSSLMREVLYFNICRRYIPCAKACFVKLVINDENWGVYAHVQQLNSDFIDEWFVSDDGDRWKAGFVNTGGFPPGGGIRKTMELTGTSALTWNGDDQASYQQLYDLKTAKTDDPWQHLINVCDILNNTPANQLEESLASVLDVDRCLWFLAVENVFADDDGYLTKGADYQLYYEPETGRMHTLEYDGNEAFMMWSMFNAGVTAGPFEGAYDVKRPLIQRLLNVPRLRQRYLAHMRTIIDESLDWAVIEPKIQAYQNLIRSEVQADTKKLTTDAAFELGDEDLLAFVTQRREVLLGNQEVNCQAPDILEVSCNSPTGGFTNIPADEPVTITAEMDGSMSLSEVVLHYADGITGAFQHVSMFDDGQHDDGGSGDGEYGCEIPGYPAGTLVRYYVEARADDDAQTTSFSPAGAEHNVYIYKVAMSVAETTPVIINELMPSNQTTLQDPQGDYDDWIELVNISDQEVDLSGMYLSDKEDNLTKWQIPDGTTIASGEYLLVWADEDGGDEPGLHANFKLSADGESVFLVDTDEHGNAILDMISFPAQDTDCPYGRYPDCTGEFTTLSAATPCTENTAGPVQVAEESQPYLMDLMQNYPNPCNSHTVIPYSISERTHIELDVYNLAGQRIASLADGVYEPGTYQVRWDGKDDYGFDMASGVYVYLLKAGPFSRSRSLLLLR